MAADLQEAVLSLAQDTPSVELHVGSPSLDLLQEAPKSVDCEANIDRIQRHIPLFGGLGTGKKGSAPTKGVPFLPGWLNNWDGDLK